MGKIVFLNENDPRRRRYDWIVDWRQSAKGNFWRVMRHWRAVVYRKRSGYWTYLLVPPEGVPVIYHSGSYLNGGEAQKRAHAALLARAYPEEADDPAGSDDVNPHDAPGDSPA